MTKSSLVERKEKVLRVQKALNHHRHHRQVLVMEAEAEVAAAGSNLDFFKLRKTHLYLNKGEFFFFLSFQEIY